MTYWSGHVSGIRLFCSVRLQNEKNRSPGGGWCHTKTMMNKEVTVCEPKKWYQSSCVVWENNTHKETYTDSGHVPTEEVFIVFFGERLMLQWTPHHHYKVVQWWITENQTRNITEVSSMTLNSSYTLTKKLVKLRICRWRTSMNPNCTLTKNSHLYKECHKDSGVYC